MPKFGMKRLLIGFAVVAIWLATFQYVGGEDVRASFMLLILLTSMLATIYCRRRNRAFAIGFFAVMFIAFTSEPKSLFPQHRWLQYLWGGDDWDGRYPPTHDTVQFIASMILASLVGYIGTYIYDQTRESDDA
jgi:hypothetical protein